MRPNVVPRILQDLSTLGECAVIPYLVPLLMAGTPTTIGAADEAIASLLIAATVEDLVGLDQSMRDRYTGIQWDVEWDAIEISRIPAGANAATSSILLKLLSMHPNGRVREAAVKSLDAVDDGSEISFLLLRVNDWVPQVRERASGVLAARLVPAFVHSFVSALPLLARLYDGQRVDHRDLLRAIAKVITSTPDGRAALIAAMAGDDRAIRRAALRMATLDSAADFEPFILPGSKMADPVVRLFVARAAAAAPRRGDRLGLFSAFAADPFASVRVVALAALAANFPSAAQAYLDLAVMDRSGSVRDLARFELRKRGRVNFAAVYREAMTSASPARLATAIDGMAEVGERFDAEVILPFLSHPNARVRCASVRAVVHLGGETLLRAVLPMLHDPANSVSSLAVRMLSRHAAVIGAAEIQTQFRVSVAPLLRTNLLRMIAALPKWDSIRMLLDAATDRDAAVASVARDHVRRWITRYNRSSVAPSHEQIELLRAAVSNAKSAIEPGLIREIRFVLDSWSRR